MKNYIVYLILPLLFFSIQAAELDFYNKSDQPIIVNYREHALSDRQKNVELPELLRHYVKNGRPIPEALNPFRKKETKYIAPGDKAHFQSGNKGFDNIRLMTIDEYLPNGDTKTVAVILPNINWSDTQASIIYYSPHSILVNNAMSRALQTAESLLITFGMPQAMLPLGIGPALAAAIFAGGHFSEKQEAAYSSQIKGARSAYGEAPITETEKPIF